jgi:DNA-binding response OmpR family regulator
MPPETTKQPVPEQPRTTAKLRFLLVDEDHNDLEYYRELLEEQGYIVCVSSSYESALCSLAHESFDFVLVGEGTPASKGRCVLEQALDLDRRRPVVVLTRCLEMECYLDAMQLGAADYLEKPVSPVELARVVTTHVRPARREAGAEL